MLVARVTNITDAIEKLKKEGLWICGTDINTDKYYYEQDLKWENPEDTPLNIISRAFPDMFQKQVRKHLADCAIKKEHVMQEISTLSGGEQAKVKLCKLTLTPCNILILDEPTNHLDMDTKEELKKALREFDGTVILVSHEEAFYRDLATRVVSIEKLCI